MQSIHKALSPVSSLTDILSGDTYATVSAVLPIVHLIDTKLLKEMDEDSQLTKDIKHRIKQDLQTRYTEIKLGVEVMDIVKVASVLDPRFKMKYVTDDIAVKENIVIECSGLGPTPSTSSTSIIQNSAENLPPAKKHKTLGTLFKDHKQEEDVMAIISPEQKINSELEAYITARKLDFEEDPLLWWKLQAPSYPYLSKLAQKYFSVCATCSASERLFSTSGQIVTPCRATLNPDKVNMLTFLSRNL